MSAKQNRALAAVFDINQERKETVGMFCFIESSLKARVVDVVVKTIEGESSLVYITEGDFCAFVPSVPAYQKEDGKLRGVWLEASISTEEEHKKDKEELHRAYEEHLRKEKDAPAAF